MAKNDRYGTGQETGPDYPGHNPSVGKDSASRGGKSTDGGDCMKTPSGYKRTGYKRSGTHSPSED